MNKGSIVRPKRNVTLQDEDDYRRLVDTSDLLTVTSVWNAMGDNVIDLEDKVGRIYEACRLTDFEVVSTFELLTNLKKVLDI